VPRLPLPHADPTVLTYWERLGQRLGHLWGDPGPRDDTSDWPVGRFMPDRLRPVPSWTLETPASCVLDFAVPPAVPADEGTSAALFDHTREHRYLLARVWDQRRPPLVFIMLNPSTADATRLDPTVTRCLRRAQRGDWGGVLVLNAFSLRSTEPRALLTAARATDPTNDKVIAAAVDVLEETAADATVVCAWGTWAERVIDPLLPGPGKPSLSRHATLTHRLAVQTRPGTLRCLGRNGGGTPKHPLYLPTDQPLQEYP
jgi:hypothetical protein